MEITISALQAIRETLEKTKKMSDDYDYFELSKSDFSIIGRNYEYEEKYEYDYCESYFIGKFIVAFSDSCSSYFFDYRILNNIDLFTSTLPEIISKRNLCKALFNKLYNKIESADKFTATEFIIDFKNNKLQKNVYYLDDDYNENHVCDDEDEGIFVLDMDECLEEPELLYDDEVHGVEFSTPNVLKKPIEKFCIESIESYYKINLFYCWEDFIVL